MIGSPFIQVRACNSNYFPQLWQHSKISNDYRAHIYLVGCTLSIRFHFFGSLRKDMRHERPNVNVTPDLLIQRSTNRPTALILLFNILPINSVGIRIHSHASADNSGCIPRINLHWERQASTFIGITLFRYHINSIIFALRQHRWTFGARIHTYCIDGAGRSDTYLEEQQNARRNNLLRI